MASTGEIVTSSRQTVPAWPSGLLLRTTLSHCAEQRSQLPESCLTMRSGARFFVEKGARTGQARRRGRVRRGEAEVLPGERGGHPAPWRARDQALPDQERLGDYLDRLGFLADRDGEAGQPGRPAAEPGDQGP